MSSLSEELARFVVETKFEHLPDEIVYEAKRVLLDSIGCGIGGIEVKKGKISIEMARKFGGPPESSIIGIGDKVSCCHAAFANGELMNALDYNIVPHIPVFVVPPALALAESTRASGRDLILTTVLAQEISKRLQSGLGRWMDELGENHKTPPVCGNGQESIFGGTAGVGKLLGLGHKEMTHALGIAGYFCPVPSSGKWFNTSPQPMIKYAPAGWLCLGAVTAAQLAGMGYTGDTTVFDGEYGFWRFYGSSKWDPDAVMKELGKTWRFADISYKLYPCGRFFHSPLDCFISIIEKNNLRPEEIESVKTSSFPFVISKPPMEVKNQTDAQFCQPYVFAVAVHRVKRGADWLDLEMIKDPKILAFMKKVSVEVHPESAEAKRKDPRSWLARVEVRAKGKTFTEERMYAKGTAFTDSRATDEELVEKFRGNASKLLTEDKIDKAIKLLFELERVDNIQDLMKQVTL